MGIGTDGNGKDGNGKGLEWEGIGKGLERE